MLYTWMKYFPWPHYRPGNMGIFSACNTHFRAEMLRAPLAFWSAKLQVFASKSKLISYFARKSKHFFVEDRLFTTFASD